MANKPEYVDLIGEATRQHRRRATPLRIVAKPEVEETSKLSRWPPAMIKQWKAREPDTVEAGVMEAEGLALGQAHRHARARPGHPRIFFAAQERGWPGQARS
ncbi:hypothetical protein ABIF75_006248 [Bradyrhizobium japonicum]